LGEGLHPSKTISHDIDQKMGGTFTTSCPKGAEEVQVLVRTKFPQLGKDSFSLGKQLNLLANVPVVHFTITKKSRLKALMEGMTYDLTLNWEGNLDVPLVFMAGEGSQIKSSRDRDAIPIEDLHQDFFQDKQSLVVPFNFEPANKKKQVYFCLFPKKSAHIKKVDIQGNNLGYPF